MKEEIKRKKSNIYWKEKKGIYVKAIIVAWKIRSKAFKIVLMENHSTQETVGSQLCNKLLCDATYPCSVFEMLVPYVTEGFGSCLGDPLTHYTSIMSSVSNLLGVAACAVLLRDYRDDHTQLAQCLLLRAGEATAV